MRTLKKTLALVLVVAMMLSFGVIGANAAFTDVTEKTNYNEAITVLTGMGVINGMTATTFAPDGTLTREQAAKIVAYVKLGPVNAQLVSSASSSRFSDVEATRWSAGYIEYCANLGIINGLGDGTFNPEGKLTVAAFTKMLLVAVGVTGDFTGDSWALNVATAAISANVYDKNIVINNKDEITRAQACQLAFLALNYSKNGSTTVYTVTAESGAVLYTGSDAITALLMKQSNTGSTLTAESNSTGSLGDTVFGLTKGTASDAFGRKSVTYTNGKTGTAKVTYASFAPTAKLSYTTATTYGAIVKALGYTKAADKVSFNYFNNTATSAAVTGKDITSADAIGAQGTLLEVYATSTADVYDLVQVDTYVKTIAKGDITAANKTTGADRFITIESGMAYTTDEFVAGDVVLYTKADSAIVNVVKAASVAGKVTATATGYIRVDGAQMKLAAHNADSVTIGTTAGYKVDSTKTYTYYTDSYGNIIHAVEGTTVSANVNYIYVINTAAKVSAVAGDNLFDSSSASVAAQAKVIDLATGAVSVKNIAVVKGTDGNYYYATATGAASTTKVIDKATSGDDTGFYTYTTMTDGSIVLSASKVGTTSVTLVKGSASVATGVIANANTKVTVIDYTTNYASTAVTTYTGIANFPASALTADALVVATSGLASSIVIVKSQSVTSSVNYAIYKGIGEMTGDGQAYEFYVKGEVVSYIMTDTSSFTAPAAGTVVGLTLTSGKLADKDAVAAQVAKVSAATVSYVDSTFAVATAAGTTYIVYFGTGCEVYAAGNGFAAGTIAVGDVITVFGSTAVDANHNLKDAAFVVIAA